MAAFIYPRTLPNILISHCKLKRLIMKIMMYLRLFLEPLTTILVSAVWLLNTMGVKSRVCPCVCAYMCLLGGCCGGSPSRHLD